MTSTAVTVPEAARELGLTERQLRHAMRNGAPVVHRGHRGRGNSSATLLDVEAVAAWLQARGDPSEAARRQQAREMVAAIADAIVALYRSQSAPRKAQAAAAHVLTFQLAADGVRGQLGLPPITPAEFPEAIRQMDKLMSI